MNTWNDLKQRNLGPIQCDFPGWYPTFTTSNTFIECCASCGECPRSASFTNTTTERRQYPENGAYYYVTVSFPQNCLLSEVRNVYLEDAFSHGFDGSVSIQSMAANQSDNLVLKCGRQVGDWNMHFEHCPKATKIDGNSIGCIKSDVVISCVCGNPNPTLTESTEGDYTIGVDYLNCKGEQSFPLANKLDKYPCVYKSPQFTENLVYLQWLSYTDGTTQEQYGSLNSNGQYEGYGGFKNERGSYSLSKIFEDHPSNFYPDWSSMNVTLNICITEENFNNIPLGNNVIQIGTKYCCIPTWNYDPGSGQLQKGDQGFYIEYYKVHFVKCVPTDFFLDTKSLYQEGQQIYYTIGAPSKNFVINYIQEPQDCQMSFQNEFHVEDHQLGQKIYPTWLVYKAQENSSPNFTISTSDVNFAGKYTLYVRSWFDQQSVYLEKTIKVPVLLVLPDTCEGATWNPNSVSDMSTAVNVSPPLEPQTFSESTVNCSCSCGLVTYSLNQSPFWISLDIDNRNITVVSHDSSEVGLYYMELIATLQDYPWVTQTMPFKVTITDCVVTQINVVSGALDPNANQNVLIFSPHGLVIPIPIYSQTPSCGQPQDYSLTADTIPSTGFQTSSFLSLLDQTEIQVKSSDSTQHGIQYTIQLQTTIGSLTDTQTTIITFVNPCLTTTWNDFTLNQMNATALDPTPVVQTFTACSVLAAGCGSVTFSLNQTLSFITIDSSAMTISVQSSNVSDANTYSMGLIASLDSYPFINQTLPFIVTISNCVVTNIAVATGALNATLTSTVNIFDTVGLQITIPTFTQTPSCGLTPSYKLFAATIPTTVFEPSSFLSLQDSKIIVKTSDLAYSGLIYTVLLETTIGTVIDNQTTQITFVNPCLTTTWNANSINPITATVLDPTPVIQTFTAFTVQATGCGSVEYSLNQTSLNFLTLNSTAMTISVQSSNTADAGTYYLGLIVSLVTYPNINQTLPFTITLSNCVVTSISASGGLDSAQTTTVKIFDTIGLQIPIPTFTQTPSCGITPNYALMADTIPQSNFAIRAFLYLNSSYIQVSTNDTNQNGISYTIRLQTTIGDVIDIQTTKIVFVNPCMTTTWNPNTINSMSSTVLSTTPVVQTFTAFSVQATGCGSVEYSLNQTSLNFLTLNSTAMIISVLSSNTADAGTYYLGLIVSLVTYPTINQTLPFTITISNCVVTSISASSGLDSAQTTTVNIFDTIGLQIPIPTFTQTPSCGLTPNYTLMADTIPPSSFAIRAFLQFNSSYIQVSTSDTNQNGISYTIRLQTTIGDVVDNQTTKITFVNPCLTTTWNTITLTSMNATVLFPTPVVQTFNASSVLASGCGSVTYSLNQTLSFLTLNAAAMTLNVLSSNFADVGTQYIGLIASLVDYPSINRTLPFTVTITSCIVTSLTLISGAFDASTTSQVNIFDTYGLQLAIPIYTQTPACSLPPNYTLTADTVPSTSFTAQAFLTQLSPSIIQVTTNDTTLDGKTYTIKLETTIGTVSDIQQTKVIFNNPCNDIGWISNSISNITTGVNLSPALQPQVFTPSSVTNSNCGLVRYELNQTLGFVTLNSSALTITVVSTSQADVGTYNLGLIAYLETYPAITQILPFTVTITNCVVTSITVASGAWSSTTTQNVNILDSQGIYIAIPTFTQTPACLYSANYILTADTVPSTGFISQTFFTQFNATTLQVKTSDTNLHGKTYTLKLETTVDTATDFQTTVVAFTNPCLSASFNANSLPNLTTSVNISPTMAPQSITTSTVNVPPTVLCGPVEYSLNQSLSFVTLNQTAMTITVIATSGSQSGTYPLQLQVTVTGYPNIVQNIPFTITVNPCIVTSISVVSDALDSSLVTTVTIFDPIGLQKAITSFSQVPACGYSPVYTYLGDSIPSTGYVIRPFLSQMNATTFQIKTNDFTLDAQQFIVQQLTTIGTQTNTQTTKVVFSDPCKNTQFVPQTITNTFTFISTTLIPAIVILPILDDTVNSTYPSGSTSSTCHDQTVTVTYGSLPIPFMTQSVTSSGNTNLTFASSSPSNVGTFLIDCLYSLTRYPSIKKIISFNLTLYYITVPPQIQNQTFTIGNSTLTFSMGAIQISPPLNSDFQTSYQSTLSPSGSLPPFIVGSLSPSGYQYTIQSTNKPVVGTYNIVLTTKIADTVTGKSQSVSQNVSIIIVAAAPAVVVLAPPFFDNPVATSFQISVGDSWTYTLPTYQDPQGLDVVLSAQLGSASIFTQFNAGVFSITAGSTTSANIANYTFDVLLNNTRGANIKTKITLSILAAQISQSNSTNTSDSPSSTAVKNQTIVSSTDNSTIQVQNVSTATAEQQAQAVQQQAQVEAAVATASPEAKEAMSMLQQTSTQTSQTTVNSNSSPESTFNWAAAFAKILLKAEKTTIEKVILNPDVELTAVSKTGLITLTFNKTITVSPLNMIQTATVYNITSKQKLPALRVTILPGKSSDPGNLTMTYNITLFQPKRLQIQINFENPSYVSSFVDPDRVNVEFLGYFYFFDNDGLMIAKGKTLTSPFPKQLAQKLTTTATTAAVGQATNVVMAGNFIAQLLLSGSLSQLWSMINTQQIVVLMPLFKVNLPKNAGIFFGFIMQLAAFQVIPVQSLYDIYLPAPDSDGPINDNFNAVGFQSMYFLNNMGSMIIGILSIPILLVVYWLAKILSKQWSIFKKLEEKLRNYLFWSSMITMTNETLSMVSICVFINLTIISYDSLSCIVNIGLSVTFLILCTVLPFLILAYLIFKFPILNDNSMQKRFGELYHNLDLRQGRIIAFVPFIFLIRRYFLGAVVVFSDKIIYQIIVLLAGVMAQVICIGAQVYSQQSTAYNELFNEFVITSTLYTMICFTDWIPDKNTQDNVGYVSCLLVCSHLFVNLSLMFGSSFNKILLKLKRWQYQRQSKINSSKTSGKKTSAQTTTLATQEFNSEVKNLAELGDQYPQMKRRKPIISQNGYVLTKPPPLDKIDWNDSEQLEPTEIKADKPQLPIMKRRPLALSIQASFQLELQHPDSNIQKPINNLNESLTDAIERLFPNTTQKQLQSAITKDINHDAVESQNIQQLFYKQPIIKKAPMIRDLAKKL